MFSLKINNQNVNFKINIKTLRGLIAVGDKNPIEYQGAHLKGINTFLYLVNLGEPVALIEAMKILSSYQITDECVEKEIESNSNLLVEFKKKLEEEIKKSGFIKTPLVTLLTAEEAKKVLTSKNI